MLLAKDGAEFDGAIVHTPMGFRASYRTMLYMDLDLLIECDCLLCPTHVHAKNWISWNALRRGFKRYGLTRSEH